MTLTGYLKIPDIPGESQRAGHEDEIDIWLIEWAIEQSGRSSGSRRARRRAEVQPLVAHKFYDMSSPYLGDAVDRARSFPEMVLSIRKDSGDAHLDYLTITLENAVISSYRMGGSDHPGGDQRIAERIEIVAEEIGILYRRQGDDHSSSTEHEVRISD